MKPTGESTRLLEFTANAVQCGKDLHQPKDDEQPRQRSHWNESARLTVDAEIRRVVSTTVHIGGGVITEEKRSLDQGGLCLGRLQADQYGPVLTGRKDYEQPAR